MKYIGSLILYVFCCNALAEDQPVRLVFTGDIMLSREVAHEITEKKGASPWATMQHYFTGADWVMGNFEGTIGDKKDCLGKISDPCFATNPDTIPFIKEAGFTAVSVENNHSADIGQTGKENTLSYFKKAGINAINFDNSPGFFKAGNAIFAIITLNTIAGKDGVKTDIPSPLLRQKIRLAKSMSHWVIVFVHWGVELADWQQPKQRMMADWLTKEGVDLIIGAHPHVVEAPECINGKPVFFSLGNHVFDQKYPDTKRGMIADCKVKNDFLTCESMNTQTPINSAFPAIAEQSASDIDVIKSCRVKESHPHPINGYFITPMLANHQFADGDLVLEGKKENSPAWHVAARHLLSLEPAIFETKEGRKPFFFTLEKHKSTIDQEMGARPYVYEVTPHGLVAKWRGSALAWPLLDAKILPGKNAPDYLCALHRKDSFLLLNPDSTETRTAIYSWNGFGFSGSDDQSMSKNCKQAFE